MRKDNMKRWKLLFTWAYLLIPLGFAGYAILSTAKGQAEFDFGLTFCFAFGLVSSCGLLLYLFGPYTGTEKLLYLIIPTTGASIFAFYCIYSGAILAVPFVSVIGFLLFGAAQTVGYLVGHAAAFATEEIATMFH